MRARSALLPVAIALLATGALAPSASADDFSPKTICVTTNYPLARAGCDSLQPFTRNGLQLAINRANNDADHLGDDTIRIDPGTITIDGPAESVDYSAQSGHGALHIVGAGRGQTTFSGIYTLGAPGPVFNLVAINASAAPSSSISGLSIITGAAVTTTNGLAIDAGVVDGVEISAYGDLDFTRRGLVTTGSGVTVKNSVFHAGGTNNGYGIYNSGHELNVTDTTFEHAVQGYEDDQFGIYSTGTLIAKRLKFFGEETAIRFAGERLEIYDSLFDMGAAESAVSITPGPSAASFLLQGVTVVGGAPNQTGFSLDASTGVVQGDVRDSLFDLNGAGSTEISCVSSGAGSGSQTYIFNSMYATSAGNCLMPSGGNLDRSGGLQPLYVNSAASDYRPTAGSPVIDAGQTIPNRPSDAEVDLAGLSRFVDGNGDGSAITDIGAYEFQPSPPSPPGGGGGTATPPALSIKFGKPVGNFKLKKSKPKTFTFTTGKKKPRLPVTSNLATPVELSLARSNAGWLTGKKCKSKEAVSGRPKRCDIPLKGKLAMQLPEGTSFLTFSGKWNKKKLKPGKYALTLRARGGTDAIKSVLNVIR